jgi:ComF family protein
MLEKSMASINKFQRLIRGIILPFTCIFCKKRADREQDLCQACFHDLPIVTQKCTRCAQQLASLAAEAELLCGACLHTPPPFTHTYSLFAYEPPLTTLILDLKFHQQLVYARILGELMATAVREKWYLSRPLPTLLIPVPLHPQRLKERGFNQALEIARPLSQHLRLPLETAGLKRLKNTAPQMHLVAEKRKQNLENAFIYMGNLRGKSVALMDDVMTTGSTLRAAALALLAQGAAQVVAWCCARR